MRVRAACTGSTRGWIQHRMVGQWHSSSGATRNPTHTTRQHTYSCDTHTPRRSPLAAAWLRRASVQQRQRARRAAPAAALL